MASADRRPSCRDQARALGRTPFEVCPIGRTWKRHCSALLERRLRMDRRPQPKACSHSQQGGHSTESAPHQTRFVHLPLPLMRSVRDGSHGRLNSRDRGPTFIPVGEQFVAAEARSTTPGHRHAPTKRLIFRVMEPEAADRPVVIMADEPQRVESSGGARQSAGGSGQRFFFRIGCSGLDTGDAGGGLSSRTLGLSLARYDSPSTMRS
jgi:hypothetical protein